MQTFCARKCARIKPKPKDPSSHRKSLDGTVLLPSVASTSQWKTSPPLLPWLPFPSLLHPQGPCWGRGWDQRDQPPGPRRLPASLSLQQKTRRAQWVSREQLSVHRRLPVWIFHWGRLGVLLLFWIQTFFFHRNISTNLPALQLLDFCTCSRVHGMFALNAW